MDVAIITKLDKASLTPGDLRGVGATTYTWESYENDLQLDSLNSLVMVEGVDKLAQSIMKIILTPKGSDPDDPDYGTNLNLSIGEKFSSEAYSQAQTEVVSALIHLNQINIDNPNSDEVIETIDNVSTVADADDPRSMRIYVSVTTESGKRLNVVAPQLT